jgi:hypothetical protein
LLHCPQAADHCLDLGPGYLVFVDQGLSLPLPAGAVCLEHLVLAVQIVAQGDQFIDLLFKNLELIFRHGVILRGSILGVITIEAPIIVVNDTNS